MTINPLRRPATALASLMLVASVLTACASNKPACVGPQSRNLETAIGEAPLPGIRAARRGGREGAATRGARAVRPLRGPRSSPSPRP